MWLTERKNQTDPININFLRILFWVGSLYGFLLGLFAFENAYHEHLWTYANLYEKDGNLMLMGGVPFILVLEVILVIYFKIT